MVLMSKLVLKSTRIYTGKEDEIIDGYVFIDGSEIEAVLEVKDVTAQMLEGFELQDYGDSFLMPGFCDYHVHLVNTATILRDGDLRFAKSEEEAAEMLWKINKDAQDKRFIMGGAWDEILWERKGAPSKESLDKYFPDTPVFLVNKECHGAWVNSKTLDLFGVDKDTPDPPKGVYFRDQEGNPTGYLHEGALYEIQDKIFDMMTDSEISEYAKSFIREANKYGITSLGDVIGVSGVNYKAYEHLLDTKQLNARIFFSLEFAKSSQEIAGIMKDYHDDMLKCNGVKAFIDGTPQGHTGYMLEEYSDKKGEVSFPLIKKDELFEKIKDFDKNGIQVRIHACGDAGVRCCLDAFENALEKNGQLNNRHCVEHIEVIFPTDIKRFAELGVVASVQPEHMPKYVFEDHPFHKILGEKRMAYAYPIGTILNAGGCLAFGTDSPVAPLNPTRGIYRAVNRLTNEGTPKGGWNPWEKISIFEAINAYTFGGVYAGKMDNLIGTLESGKKADITVLEKDIVENQNNLEIMLDVEALMTMVDGRIVHRKG